MKIKYLLAASAALVITASSANAADVVETAPYEQPAVVAVPTFSWNGAYAGLAMGGSWLDTKTASEDESGKSDSKTKAKGVIGGLYAGYNFEVTPNVILGAETDFAWGNVKKNSSTVTELDDGDYTSVSTVKQKWAGATRLRVGYAMDRFMPFLAGGVAYSQISNSGVNTLGEDNKSSYSFSKTLTGWTIGAGVDYAVADNILVRLEYRYTDYGNKSISYTTPSFGDRTDKIDYKTNDVRVGVAYKF